MMATVSTGRFAPSPTGDLHLGNLRTAVLAWLWARRDRGGFIVRMEDLDRVTSRPEFERSQLADLEALGLDWDGVVVRQSERFDRYHEVLVDLEARGLTFECFCTRREIAQAASAPNGPATSGAYPGTCRNLSEARRRRLRDEGRPAAIRLRSDHRCTVFVDEVLGERSGCVDDVVLRRNDGVPAYNLAVVIDDVAQGIDLVVRGDDLVDTVPTQALLRDVLGAARARFAHVPLVMSERGTRLAKRDGAVTLADRHAIGDSTSAVLWWLLASIGVELDRDLAHASPRELVTSALDLFDRDRLPREALRLTNEFLARQLPDGDATNRN